LTDGAGADGEVYSWMHKGRLSWENFATPRAPSAGTAAETASVIVAGTAGNASAGRTTAGAATAGAPYIRVAWRSVQDCKVRLRV
jgi:hypothetical protein